MLLEMSGNLCRLENDRHVYWIFCIITVLKIKETYNGFFDLQFLETVGWA